MRLSDLKTQLEQMNEDEMRFVLPGGKRVPAHFHITESGLSAKHFIDCGGQERKEEKVSFQVWVADDTMHRLSPSRLVQIIDISACLFAGRDPEVEIEYQLDTIGKFGLEYHEGEFHMTAMQTRCLAEEKCGRPAHRKEKKKLALQDLSSEACCEPGSGCC